MTPDIWDETEEAIKAADMALAALFAALPDDMAHTSSRNRIVNAMVSIEDCSTFVQRARTLAAEVAKQVASASAKLTPAERAALGIHYPEE